MPQVINFHRGVLQTRFTSLLQGHHKTAVSTATQSEALSRPPRSSRWLLACAVATAAALGGLLEWTELMPGIMPPEAIDNVIFGLWRRAHGEPKAPGRLFRSHFFPGHTVAHRVCISALDHVSCGHDTTSFSHFLNFTKLLQMCMAAFDMSWPHCFHIPHDQLNDEIE